MPSLQRLLDTVEMILTSCSHAEDYAAKMVFEKLDTADAVSVNVAAQDLKEELLSLQQDSSVVSKELANNITARLQKLATQMLVVWERYRQAANVVH